MLETVLQRQKPGLNATFYVKGLPPLVVDGYSKILKQKQLLRDKPQHIPVQPRTAQFNFPSLLLSPIPSPTPEQEIDSNQGSSPQSFSNYSSQAPLSRSCTRNCTFTHMISFHPQSNPVESKVGTILHCTNEEAPNIFETFSGAYLLSSGDPQICLRAWGIHFFSGSNKMVG